MAGDNVFHIWGEGLEEFFDAVGWVGEVFEDVVDFFAGGIRHVD